jgi:putative ABC transport system permease protein
VKLAILAEGDPQSLTAVVREEIHKLDRQLAIQSIEVMEQRVRDSVALQRFGTMLVTAFAIGALFLAAVGLYGLLAYSVTQRRREIGVRMALGAQREGVIRMVAAQGAKPVFTGLVAGLVASFGTVRLLESLLYQTGRYDLVTFVAVPVVLITVALTACAVPAWRAARIEPLIALRAE